MRSFLLSFTGDESCFLNLNDSRAGETSKLRDLILDLIESRIGDSSNLKLDLKLDLVKSLTGDESTLPYLLLSLMFSLVGDSFTLLDLKLICSGDISNRLTISLSSIFRLSLDEDSS